MTACQHTRRRSTEPSRPCHQDRAIRPCHQDTQTYWRSASTRASPNKISAARGFQQVLHVHHLDQAATSFIGIERRPRDILPDMDLIIIPSRRNPIAVDRRDIGPTGG